MFGADNTLWLQYAKGSTWLDMGFAGGNQDSDYKRWRIADSLAWLKGPLTAQTLLHYGKAEEPAAGGGTNSATTLSLAGRVAYAFTKNFKLQGELGTARTKPDGGSSQTRHQVHHRTDADGGPELLRPSGTALLRVDVQVQRRLRCGDRPVEELEDGSRLPGRDLVLIDPIGDRRVGLSGPTLF